MGIRSQNNPIAAYLDVFSSSGTDASTSGGGSNFGTPQGITATGGVINDFIETGPGNVYRTHIFTSTGTFNVTNNSGNFGDTVECLVVAGGGACGPHYGGGGGAGGLRTNVAGVVNASGTALNGPSLSVTASPYTVVVGGGGAANGPAAQNRGSDGSPSSFSSITSTGGGAGGANQPNLALMKNGENGGSGGGAKSTTAGQGNNPPTSPPQGNPGGVDPTGGSHCGGGGGAGASGGNGDSSNPGAGGIGVQVKIAGPPTFTGYGALNP